MAESKFDVQFVGELVEGADALAVRDRLRDQFKLSPKALERLFSGEPIVVKRDLDYDIAVRYREAFSNAGAIAHVTPSPESTVGDPDLSHAPAGPDADEDARLTRVAIDTTGLSLVPGHDWTLEDCAPVVVPPRLPDISHLTLVPLEPVAPHPVRDYDE